MGKEAPTAAQTAAEKAKAADEAKAAATHQLVPADANKSHGGTAGQSATTGARAHQPGQGTPTASNPSAATGTHSQVPIDPPRPEIPSSQGSTQSTKNSPGGSQGSDETDETPSPPRVKVGEHHWMEPKSKLSMTDGILFGAYLPTKK